VPLVLYVDFTLDKYSMSYFSKYLNFFNGDKGILGDYTHASDLYIRNNLRLAPKTKFLYHVVFDINANAINSLGRSVAGVLDTREFNLLVQSVELPSFSADVDTKNQYNRKRLIQTKFNYEPTTLNFHDDNAGLTTLLWESYFRYYSQDPNYARLDSTGNPSTTVPSSYSKNPDNIYAGENSNRFRYGLDRSRITNAPFFNSITVYQLHPQNIKSTFTSFTLINPLIISLQHDQMDQDVNGFSKTTMRIQYENVIYGRGLTDRDNPAGFANPDHYDVTPSPLQSNSPIESLSGLESLIGLFSSLFNDERSANFIQAQLNTDRRLAKGVPSVIDTQQQRLLQQQESSQRLPENIVINKSVNNSVTVSTQADVDIVNNLFVQPTRQAQNILEENQIARQNFAFFSATINDPGVNELLPSQFPTNGNFQDKRAAWNELPDSLKENIGNYAAENFVEIRSKFR